MKHISTPRRKDIVPPPGSRKPPSKAGGAGNQGGQPPAKPQGRSPFDVWVDRGLHAIYDGIVNEPVPDDILRLIDADRRK